MSEIPPGDPWQNPSGFSNYPRANDPNIRPPGVYFEDIGRAWTLLRANLSTWVLTILVGGVLIVGISFSSSLGINVLLFGTPFGGGNYADPRFYLAMLLGLIPNGITGIFGGAIMVMGAKEARGEPVAFADLFGGFPYALPLFLATILQSFAIYAGFLCLIIPAIYVMGALCFTQILVIDRKMGPVEAMGASFNALKSDAWLMFLLLFVSALAAFLGYCLCLVGILFSMPIYFITLGLAYNTYFPVQRPSATSGQPIGIEPPR